MTSQRVGFRSIKTGSILISFNISRSVITCCVLSQLTRRELSHVAYMKPASNLHHKQPEVQSNETGSMLLLFPHDR